MPLHTKLIRSYQWNILSYGKYASGGGGNNSPPLISMNETKARYAIPKIMEIAPVIMAVPCALCTSGSLMGVTEGGMGLDDGAGVPKIK